MDIATIYNAKHLPREPLPQVVLDTIAKLKISFRPSYRRSHQRRRDHVENAEWRKVLISDIVNKLKEKDDEDYSYISSCINKITKSNYEKLLEEMLRRMEKRDDEFRLRVTTLLFDRGIRSPFFAPMMAELYKDISKAYPDALKDLSTQLTMFDKLYDISTTVIVPTSTTDPTYNDAIIMWTKQKEIKKGFTIYLVELYKQDLVEFETMNMIVKFILDDFYETIKLTKTETHIEHVDALVRFISIVAKTIPLKIILTDIKNLPRDQTPSLSMKSRFAIEDAAKVSR